MHDRVLVVIVAEGCDNLSADAIRIVLSISLACQSTHVVMWVVHQSLVPPEELGELPPDVGPVDADVVIAVGTVLLVGHALDVQ